MKVKVFSIFDAKAEAFNQPFFMQAKGQAIRQFADLANDDKSGVCKHAEDYTLFELGDFDDSNGQFTLHNTPIPLGIAVEFRKPVS